MNNKNTSDETNPTLQLTDNNLTIINFCSKTETIIKTGEELEEKTCYYTTNNGMFVSNSLSYDIDEAKGFYESFVRLKGNMVKIEVLMSSTLKL
jgi:hypothetical protein